MNNQLFRPDNQVVDDSKTVIKYFFIYRLDIDLFYSKVKNGKGLLYRNKLF